MSEIGLLGDTHGNLRWVKFALWSFHERGITTIAQVGDFGIYAQGDLFLKGVRLELEKYGQTLYVVPGNHEDYDYIATIPVREDGWQHLRSNILLAPRGHRWEWGGLSFVALGGAPSVDRWARVSNPRKGQKAWWAEEAITPEDVAKVVEGGYADVMLCHDAPLRVAGIEKHIKHNPFGFKPQDLEYADEGRLLMDEAFKAVTPMVFVHGHYHTPIDEYVDNSHIIGLSCDQQNFSTGVLDTETLAAEALDIRSDYDIYTKRR